MDIFIVIEFQRSKLGKWVLRTTNSKGHESARLIKIEMIIHRSSLPPIQAIKSKQQLPEKRHSEGQSSVAAPPPPFSHVLAGKGISKTKPP